MKEMLEKLKAAEAAANEAETAWEKNPKNEELEKRFDEAYNAEFEAHKSLVNAIIEKTNGQITREEINRMLAVRRPQLESIIQRIG